jgi:hypothetical protein
VTGRKPFPREPGGRDSEDPLARFPQLHQPPLPLPDGLPAALTGLIGRMLLPDPAERPAAAEVATELEPLVASLPRKLTFSKRRA